MKIAKEQICNLNRVGEFSLTSPYSELLQKIRYGQEPQNAELIVQYLSMRKGYAFGSQAIHRNFLLTQFNLLLTVLKDKKIVKSWRCLCLEYIYEPLEGLHKLAPCIESRQYVNMLSQQVNLEGETIHSGR